MDKRAWYKLDGGYTTGNPKSKDWMKVSRKNTKIWVLHGYVTGLGVIEPEEFNSVKKAKQKGNELLAKSTH